MDKNKTFVKKKIDKEKKEKKEIDEIIIKTKNKKNHTALPINENFTIKLKDFKINTCCCNNKYIINNFDTIYYIIIRSNLTLNQKDILLSRIHRIYKKIIIKQIKNKIFYNISKTFIIIASILSPALTSLNTDTTSPIYLYLWWIVWLLQLGISLIASLSSFLKWDNNYFLFSKYKNKIENEIWNYLETNNEYHKNINNQNNIKNTYSHNLPLFFKRIEHLYKSLCDKENEIKLNDETNNNNNNNKNITETSDQDITSEDI